MKPIRPYANESGATVSAVAVALIIGIAVVGGAHFARPQKACFDDRVIVVKNQTRVVEVWP